MPPPKKGSTFCKSWASRLRPAHRLLFLFLLSSRLFKVLLTKSPQRSISWVFQNLLGSRGPSHGQRETFEDAHLQGCLKVQQPEPGAHSHSGLSPHGLATGRWLVPSNVKRGGAAGPGERCVELTLKRTFCQLTLPAAQCALRHMEHSQ